MKVLRLMCFIGHQSESRSIKHQLVKLPKTTIRLREPDDEYDDDDADDNHGDDDDDDDDDDDY